MRQSLSGPVTGDETDRGRAPVGGEVQRRTARWMVVGLAVVTAAALVAMAVAGDRFMSPAQRAAAAAPPRPSLITATVKQEVLNVDVVFRADVGYADPVPVPVPGDLGSSLPVVTAVSTRQGAVVRNGQELLRVAERPVFALRGDIPAFRDITPGTVGVDVTQLQEALRALGHSTGADPKGTYGPGTQRAVRALYAQARIPVALTSPDADTNLAHLEKVAAATAQASWVAARRTLRADQAAVPADPARVAADRSAVSAAADTRTSATHALTTARATTGVVVPRGEVVFVPTLPARTVSLNVHTGSTAPTSAPLGSLGSGQVVVSGQVEPAVAKQLKAGMAATAHSDLTDEALPLRLVSLAPAPVSGSASSGAGGQAAGNLGSDAAGNSGSTEANGAAITLAPRGAVPAGWVGQNVSVSLTTASSGRQTLIVPISAVSTDAAGRTYVTVLAASGVRRDVTVRLGLASAGEQSVMVEDPGTLRAGDRVVVGERAEGGG